MRKQDISAVGVSWAANRYIQELWIKFMHWDFAILPMSDCYRSKVCA